MGFDDDDADNGRAQAIEMLLDRDPQGGLYRAAKLLEECVPAAHASRPNLVTRSALVEQAFSLQPHCIETVAQYNAVFGRSGFMEEDDYEAVAGESKDSNTKTTTTTKQYDAVFCERVYKYQARLNAVKRQSTSRASSNSNLHEPAAVAASATTIHDEKNVDAVVTAAGSVPPTESSSPSPIVASITAAICSVYESTDMTTTTVELDDDEDTMSATTTALELSALLESVTSHPLLLLQQQQPTGSSVSWEVGMQDMILQAAKMTISSSAIEQEHDSTTNTNAWLLCALSLLVGDVVHEIDDDDDEPVDTKAALRPSAGDVEPDGKALSSSSSKRLLSSCRKDDDPYRPLQIASILALLPTMTTDDADVLPRDKNPFLLDAESMDYFGQASATYEERLEIQKARLLARLPSTRATDAPPILDEASVLVSGTPPPRPLSPAARSDTSTPLSPLMTRQRMSGEALSSDEDDDDEAAMRRMSTVAAPAAPASTTAYAAAVQALSPVAYGHNLQDPTVLTAAQSSSSEDDDDDDDDDDNSAAQALGDYGRQRADSALLDNEEELSNSLSADIIVAEEQLSLENSLNDGLMRVERLLENDVDGALLLQALTMSMPGQSFGGSGLRVVTANTRRDELHRLADVSSALGEESLVSEDPLDDSVDADDATMDASAELVGDASLPLFPKPPEFYPFIDVVKGSNWLDEHGDDSAFFDTSRLLKYGSVPSACALVHLLHHAMDIEERRRYHVARHNESREPSTVLGGIGAQLFGQTLENAKSSKSARPITQNDTDNDSALQLFVIVLMIICDKRSEAIEKLANASLRMTRAADGLDSDHDDCSDAPLLSEEEDDPALALAMNYIEDDVPRSIESLETKGMMRKAAAAAHDAAELLKSLLKEVDCWSKKVKLYSLCASYAMKSLRYYLQSLVVENFDRKINGTGLASPDGLMPSSVAVRLLDRLSAFHSVPARVSQLALLVGDDDKLEENFLSFRLYQDSIALWTECIPLTFTSQYSKVKLLLKLVRDCSLVSSPATIPRILPIDSLSCFPSSELETTCHRLQMLSRRLRVCDMLDHFVAKPILFTADNKANKATAGRSSELRGCSELVPFAISSVIDSIGHAMPTLIGAKFDLRHLFLSLCHRGIASLLLMDGLYAITESEAEESPTINVPAKAWATGDMVRVSKSPSPRLLFDTLKCSDSIAVLSSADDGSPCSGSTVLQRASKVWGTVLGATHYNPKTGVHRWAIRLDKCERGHVFVGVATSQASLKTYVGGDKHGWGMIGTQALWHDRRKLRGDYGATFRTGSTIVVTLDTDAGTLCLSTIPLEASQQTLLPQNAQQHIGTGTIEDWGIAFEGLPLDSRFFPAVGLYQRDDRVTLLAVEHGGKVVSADVRGMYYYPTLELTRDSSSIDQTRRFNALLTWEAIQFGANILSAAITSFEQNLADEFWMRSLLPSLSAALCLAPRSIPVLSTRVAFILIPHVCRCITELRRICGYEKLSPYMFSSPREGRWKIRATGSSMSSSNIEEYMVDLKDCLDEKGHCIGFTGNGIGTTGKSKNGLVSIAGTSKGTSVHFVEEWSEGRDNANLGSIQDSSSCVIAARLSLDGLRFEGSYCNVQYGTVGHIVGLQMNPPRQPIILNEPPLSTELSSDAADAVQVTETILCLAMGHLVTIVSEDATHDHSFVKRATGHQLEAHHRKLRATLSNSFLSSCSLKSTDAVRKYDLDQIREIYRPTTGVDILQGLKWDDLLSDKIIDDVGIASLPEDVAIVANGILAIVDGLDNEMVSRSGGPGSLSMLSPANYSLARRHIIAVIAYISGSLPLLMLQQNVDVVDCRLKEIWLGALQIIEDGVRGAFSKAASGRDACSRACNQYIEMSQFILSLQLLPWRSTALSRSEAIHEVACLFSAINDGDDLSLLKQEMICSSKRAIVRVAAFKSMMDLVSVYCMSEHMLPLEFLCASIPRLLGREQIDQQSASLSSFTHDPGRDLGGHYLSGLAGSCCGIRNSLRQIVYRLFSTITPVLAAKTAQRSLSETMDEHVAIDSLTLSVLSVFAVAWEEHDIEILVADADILFCIRNVLSSHRSLALEANLSARSDGNDVALLGRICQRDVSRSILQCAAAVVSTLVYQAAAKSPLKKPLVLKACLDALFHELEATFPLLERESNMRAISSAETMVESDLGAWATVKVKSAFEKGFMSPHGRSGLRYLQDKGTMANLTIQRNRPRLATQHSSKLIKPHPAELNIITSTPYSSAYISRWLDLVSTAVGNHVSLDSIASDSTWLDILLFVSGVKIERNAGGDFIAASLRQYTNGFSPIQANFRSRILYFLAPVVARLCPSLVLIEGLFTLAGHSSHAITKSLDDDEARVSCETVSILRKLHSPALHEWRDAVNRSINACAACPHNDSAWFAKQLGVLIFLSGDMVPVTQGAYVLMKPASAAAISQANQSIQSSKAQNISSMPTHPAHAATAHHVAGNGTDSVIAGICRHHATAGVISNIDAKSGSCEVVLVSHETGVKRNLAESLASHLQQSRYSFAVRALRIPFPDLVLNQETPLFLTDDVPVNSILHSMFLTAIKSLLSTLKCSSDSDPAPVSHVTNRGTKPDSGGPWSGIMGVSFDLCVLRSCIVILSERRLLSAYLASGKSMILETMLQLSSPNKDSSAIWSNDLVQDLQDLNLSSLPMLQARVSHILSMMRNAMARSTSLDKTPTLVLEKLLKKAEAAALSTVDASGSAAAGLGIGAFDKSNKAIEVKTTKDSTSQASNIQAGGMLSREARVSRRERNEEASAANGEAAAAHLFEVALAQMAELGLPRSWSELALRRTGGADIEAAVTFCLERGGEMERLLAEERERERIVHQAGTARQSAAHGSMSNHQLQQLLEMGFPRRWCAEALSVTGNNVDEALTWILMNGERLSEEDEDMGAESDGDDELNEREEGCQSDDDVDEYDDEDDDDDDDDADDAGLLSSPVELKAASLATILKGWTGFTKPLRSISGHANIDNKTLEVSGLPTGGFSSVGTKGILLTSGRWYYEAVLETAGCLQIGWADASFASHCDSERGDGCGDGPSSWAYDGWRRYRWHSSATEWGCRWEEGDVVGCLVDLDDHVVSFTMNGLSEEIGMGVAFSGEGFRPAGGVYACVSFNRKEKLRLILGGPGNEAFMFGPPQGYRGVGDGVLDATAELDSIMKKEQILGDVTKATSGERRFICDFSDENHGHELMAWSHRYFGADASVHLGSGRAKRIELAKAASASNGQPLSPATCVSNRVSKALSSEASRRITADDDISSVALAALSSCYQKMIDVLAYEFVKESVKMSVLLARKLILHLIITAGNEFDPHVFIPESSEEVNNTVLLWNVLESCASLRRAGWTGEAGAMALAAEALGLGISSSDAQMQVLPGRNGLLSAGDLDDFQCIPAFGSLQLLANVQTQELGMIAFPPCALSSAPAESSMASDSGAGILVFLREGLQSAICKSRSFHNVILAILRRSVRLLALVEYETDATQAIKPKTDSDAQADASSQSASENHLHAWGGSSITTYSPDARLISFLSGALLSVPVEQQCDNFADTQGQLAALWSLGMLSASIPWRMISGFTLAGILNQNPHVLSEILLHSPTVARYLGRLPSTLVRRIWAERAASPVCSRYLQAIIELVTSIKRAIPLIHDLPVGFKQNWCEMNVDAACPLPLQVVLNDDLSLMSTESSSWESVENFISRDAGWEIWTGSVEYMAVSWKPPAKSTVRSLMDAGEGPPMLRSGQYVLRGPDWGADGKEHNEDGKPTYEAEKKARDLEKRRLEAADKARLDNINPAESTDEITEVADLAESSNYIPIDSALADPENMGSKQSLSGGQIEQEMKMKLPSPKLPLGTVTAVEPWNGVKAMGRRVRWHLTGEEGIYRFGGDGGRFDLCHVKVNAKHTRVTRKHPLPETAEQCAARHGFGRRKIFHVILRIRRDGCAPTPTGASGVTCAGILEWPDFGAGVRVTCVLYDDGKVLIEEHGLLFGAKDYGWEARFGQPSFVTGTTFLLSPTEMSSADNQHDLDIRSSWLSCYDKLSGRTEFPVKLLHNRTDAKDLVVTSEMRVFRGRSYGESSAQGCPTPPPPITFDKGYHASSISLSRDGRTASCIGSEGRGAAFASIGFTKGVHYWEIKLEQADIGSVFIGVAEKPNGSGSGSTYGLDSPPKLNRWHGWGFVNFRATFSSGAERVYGAHCHGGDTVGVLLDCDAGRVGFFFDGLKYGEHILNDLGVAFENIAPFGFNIDGCGSGGSGQGAPSGVDIGRSGRHPVQGSVCPRTLWPVIGLRNQGDRVTFSCKWNSSYGVDGVATLRNILAFDEILNGITNCENSVQQLNKLPSWFIDEAFEEYKQWYDGRWTRCMTRGSGPYKHSNVGLAMDFDTSPKACASASASLGIPYALLAGDRVRLTRSAGRILELTEEAVVLGTFQGRLFYRIVSQKSEGGSLNEGGGRAWCWDESEVVDGMHFVNAEKGLGVKLPKLDRFKCLSSGGLRIIYPGGAVLRSDIEIFDGSSNLGTIPVNTIIAQKHVLERRVNSCGVVRYRVNYNELGEGWISARIRGGKEEFILESVLDDAIVLNEPRFPTPADCASAWYNEWSKKATATNKDLETMMIADVGTFGKLLGESIIPGLSPIDSDSAIAAAVSTISNFTEHGDGIECLFRDVASNLSFVLRSRNQNVVPSIDGSSAAANQATATIFANMDAKLPLLAPLLAKVAFLKALNRRAQYALPWISLGPCQEGSGILGGLAGYGTSVNRAGRSGNNASDSWVQVPSIATRLRAIRGLLFTSVKRSFLESITDCTTTPTPLSHDEYELPREIRTVRVNRLKATRAMLSGEPITRRKHSVFAQLQSETKSWGSATLRRGYVAKGHGGQKRAFKVKLVGEGVNDYSGPYREIFTDAVRELATLDEKGSGALGILDPTPNQLSEVGEGRDLFMFSLNGRDIASEALIPTSSISKTEAQIRRHFSSLLDKRDESTREVEEALVFLGRLTGTAFRHGISVDLSLPMELVWKSLAEDNVSEDLQLKELDYLAWRQQKEQEECISLSSPLLVWQQRMLNSFVEGLSNVIPVEIFPLFTGKELQETICGNPDVDTELLHQVVEYEGYEEADATVQYFWQALREFTNDDRKRFLQFVWARNRLPMRACDFDAPFKLLKDVSYTNTSADDALPSASTCFFSLTLPEYSSLEVLSKKLLFAIHNVTTMETDYQTNAAEIAEGYRAL